MERDIILNFICANFSYLSKLDMKEITILEYGRTYQNDLYRSIDSGDNLYLFNVKLPRVYQKVLDMTSLDSVFFEYAKSLKCLTINSVNDFDDSFLEPYLGKKIPSLSVNYLYLYPVISADVHLGLIVIYANNYYDLESLNSSSITQMFKNLPLSLENTFINDLSKLFDYQKDSYALNLDSKWLYSNDINKDTCDNFISDDKTSCRELLVLNKSLKVYYQIKNKEFEEYLILHKKSLSKLKLPKNFNLLYIENDLINIRTKIKDVVSKLNISSYYVSIIDDNLLLFIILDSFTKKELHNIVNTIYSNQYYLIISSNSDITSYMNFEKLSTFIETIHPDKYKEEEYCSFIESLGRDSYSLEKSLSKSNIKILNTTSMTDVIQLINYYVNQTKYDYSFRDYESKLLNNFKKQVKEGPSKLALFINSKTLNNRIFTNTVNRLIDLDKTLMLIIHYDSSTDITLFYESISKLHSKGITIVCDSSVYFNPLLIEGMSVVDGIFVNKEEEKSMNAFQNDFVSYFVSYFYSLDKLIVFENNDQKLNDKKIYYMKES